jgi:preprotein translocase subunit SecF
MRGVITLLLFVVVITGVFAASAPQSIYLKENSSFLVATKTDYEFVLGNEREDFKVKELAVSRIVLDRKYNEDLELFQGDAVNFYFGGERYFLVLEYVDGTFAKIKIEKYEGAPINVVEDEVINIPEGSNSSEEGAAPEETVVPSVNDSSNETGADGSDEGYELSKTAKLALLIVLVLIGIIIFGALAAVVVIGLKKRKTEKPKVKKSGEVKTGEQKNSVEPVAAKNIESKSVVSFDEYEKLKEQLKTDNVKKKFDKKDKISLFSKKK